MEYYSKNSPERQKLSNDGPYKSLISTLFRPTDPSSLAIFRFLFGLILLLDLVVERGYSKLPEVWSDELACHFPLFQWLPIVSLPWLHMIYFVMFLSSIGICLGLFFRASSAAFAVAYWYVVFMETTVWNNHTYLYGLVAIVFALSNANYAWSIDGLIWSSVRNKYVPNWNYAILRFQIFIVYFYAGIKKLDSDWVQGYSMQSLSNSFVFDPFRLLLTNEQIDFFIVHLGGLFIDLTTGFFLLNKNTRIIGFAQGCSFHLMNSQMFSIGMFPWAMLSTMVLFLPFDWPKQIAKRLPSALALLLPCFSESKANYTCSITKKGRLSNTHWLIAVFLSHYVIIQLTLPFSHSVTKGYNSWSEGLYGYSWDMMVKRWNQQHFVIRVVDGATNDVTYLKPGVWLSGATRLGRVGGHPDVIKKYAQCISQNAKEHLNITQPEVYFDIWRSMNTRFQQRAVDPTVNMVTALWDPFTVTPWYKPLLSELTPWREKFKEIKNSHGVNENTTNVVFVADFPGLYLENYIEESVDANITLLEGKANVEIGNKNISLDVGETLKVPHNQTHLVYTLSDTPSCYMYASRYQYDVTEMEDAEDEDPSQLKRYSIGRIIRQFNNSLWRTYFSFRFIALNDMSFFNSLNEIRDNKKASPK